MSSAPERLASLPCIDRLRYNECFFRYWQEVLEGIGQRFLKSPLFKNLNSSLVRHLYVLCIPLPKNLLKLMMHGISFSVRRTRQVTIWIPHLTVYHITLKEPTSRHISGVQHFVQCRTFLRRTDLGGNWKMMYYS